MSAPVILTIDSALGAGSAALCSGGAVLYAREIPEKGQQARLLVSTIESLLKDAGIRYPQLSGIVTTIGPGGFTGIRIALATARALSFTAGLPVQGVSTLACLAYAYNMHDETSASSPFCCILPAGKNTVYAQMFETPALISKAPPALLAIDVLQAVRMPIVTATASRIDGMLESLLCHVPLSAATAGQLAMDVTTQHHLTNAQPLYIRAPDITMPKNSAPIQA